MDASTIIFYILAAVTLGGGFLAVLSRRIFRSAIYLLFSLLGIAGLYFWLSYEFIAAVQIAVYVGGIVVLIIFSIFLTNQSGGNMQQPGTMRMLVSGFAILCGLGLTLLLISRYAFKPSGGTAVEPSAENIGEQMLSTTEHGYLLPFELVSILLLAAMIGCIVIAMKTKAKT